jgi:hypothetical protein
MIGPLFQQVLQNAHLLGHAVHAAQEMYEAWERNREEQRETAELNRRIVEERQEQSRQTAAGEHQDERRRQDQLDYQREAARLQQHVDEAHARFLRSVEQAAVASGQSTDHVLAKLRSIPSVTPSTTVPCPVCGKSLKHLGNAGLHTCATCGADVNVWQCPYCSQWRSSTIQSSVIASIAQPCPHCNNQGRDSRVPEAAVPRVPNEAELNELTANLRKWLTPNPYTD